MENSTKDGYLNLIFWTVKNEIWKLLVLFKKIKNYFCGFLKPVILFWNFFIPFYFHFKILFREGAFPFRKGTTKWRYWLCLRNALKSANLRIHLVKVIQEYGFPKLLHWISFTWKQRRSYLKFADTKQFVIFFRLNFQWIACFCGALRVLLKGNLGFTFKCHILVSIENLRPLKTGNQRLWRIYSQDLNRGVKIKTIPHWESFT